MMKNHATNCSALKGGLRVGLRGKTVKGIALGFISVLLFASLLGASVWEGAAAVSSGGEFPDSGFYLATNSFPRNTVVDITNLETGKTVRAIVATGLDSPGLLAVVSKECADAIGMRNRSIGRIRMIQPADPIAFSRFGEESLRSGDPDYDPEAALKAYGEETETAAATGTVPESAGAAEAPIAAVVPGKTEKTSDKPEETVQGGKADEPVKENETEKPAGETETAAAPLVAENETEETQPVTETEAEEAPLVTETETDAGESGAEIVEVPEEPVVAVLADEPVPADVPVKEPVPETIREEAETADYSEPAPVDAVIVTALPRETLPEEAETAVAKTVPEENAPEVAYPEESVWYIPPEEGSVFTLVPAEERPPAATDTTIPEIAIIPPVRSAEEVREPAYVPGVFSVPSVGELESGKYYLQLGAYSKTEAVEQEIAKIEKNLPLAIQHTGGADKPVYRILVGPVNHGESGALLQRFKGIGYKDAFIRRGE
jgi:hypothetical protein